MKEFTQLVNTFTRYITDQDDPGDVFTLVDHARSISTRLAKHYPAIQLIKTRKATLVIEEAPIYRDLECFHIMLGDNLAYALIPSVIAACPKDGHVIRVNYLYGLTIHTDGGDYNLVWSDK